MKKKVVRLTEEAGIGKAKARRLEEDNKNKEKQLESLLDPSKSEEMRRTLGERGRGEDGRDAFCAFRTERE